ncbi:hypothetical protein [Saccharolobus caldissimus]|uniref:Uncharacterized protein n=1 Tax=Saccharolobus caldissimus TaxID=1702097 RepID=A0AAQ4CWV1_9CREN|nr:hypothetical protein [Saccharolobus caldissimus]BDC00283.1 hypothetical protein SACC_32990 [Saccharolobus caldissimus]
MTENKKDKKQVNVSFISFPSKEIFEQIYNELSEEGKKELDRMMKEGRVKIY